MNTLRAVSIASVLVSAAATGCNSSGSSGGQAEAGAGGGGGTCSKSYVACDLLSASDVSTALGMTVTAGKETDAHLIATDYSYSCNYGPSSDSTSVGLTVSCNTAGKNGPDLYNLQTGIFGGTATPIAGLGEAAFWLPGDSDAGGSPKTLIVYFGGHSNFEVTVVSSGPSSVDPEAVARKVATIVAKNLML